MNIKISTRGRSGKFSRKISATTNDPESPKVTLTCAGHVLVAFKTDPRVVNFARVDRSAGPQTKTVKITRGDGGPLALELVPIEQENIKAALREVEPGEQYELDVTIGPPWPKDYVRTQLQLKTGIPELPEEKIRVYGRVAPRLSAMPSRFIMPRDVKKDLELTSRMVWSGDKPGKVVEATSSDPQLQVRIEERNNQECVVVSVPAGYTVPSGPRPTITVKTDDEVASLLRIPIHVARAPRIAPRAQPAAPRKPAARTGPRKPSVSPTTQPARKAKP